jgi:hypothetical protein
VQQIIVPSESSQETSVFAVNDLPDQPSPAGRCLQPAERRSRSRVISLIEYGAHGNYVTISPQEGELFLTPDSPEWFDWLASLSSFRGRPDHVAAFLLAAPLMVVSTHALGLPVAFSTVTTSCTILEELPV